MMSSWSSVAEWISSSATAASMTSSRRAGAPARRAWTTSSTTVGRTRLPPAPIEMRGDLGQARLARPSSSREPRSTRARSLAIEPAAGSVARVGRSRWRARQESRAPSRRLNENAPHKVKDSRRRVPATLPLRVRSLVAERHGRRRRRERGLQRGAARRSCIPGYPPRHRHARAWSTRRARWPTARGARSICGREPTARDADGAADERRGDAAPRAGRRRASSVQSRARRGPRARSVRRAAAPLPGVRHVIAVSSTKGGVGKSTVATNLALRARRARPRVGLLDADVYGPSIPIMIGTRRAAAGRAPTSASSRSSGTASAHVDGLLPRRAVAGHLARPDRHGHRPAVPEGRRLGATSTCWSSICRRAPATRRSTLVQQVPLTGGVIVTTPQDVALLDVGRGIAMFAQVQTPVLGIVENMAGYTCPSCGTDDAIFGEGGGARLAAVFGAAAAGAHPARARGARGRATPAPDRACGAARPRRCGVPPARAACPRRGRLRRATPAPLGVASRPEIGTRARSGCHTAGRAGRFPTPCPR